MRAKYAIDPNLKGVERTRARKLAYYYANKEQVTARLRKNKDAIAEQKKAYRDKHKEKIKAAQQEWRNSHKEQAKINAAQWRLENQERVVKNRQAYYAANRDRLLEANRLWAAENIDLIRAYHRARYQKMPEVYVAAYHKRRARQLLATPKWEEELTELVAIEAADLVRKRTKLTGIAWHTDHIVPLRGKLVSGLHVWNNLQVIPASANLAKSNAFTG